jgi:NhaP-type Na+/H+ or K+/H+ antiporter
MDTSLIGAGLIGGFIFLLCGLIMLLRDFDISGFAEILIATGSLVVIGTAALAYFTRDRD